MVIGIKSWKETTIVDDNNKINDNEATPSELVQPKNRVLQMRENILVRIELQEKWLQGLKYEGHWLSR